MTMEEYVLQNGKQYVKKPIPIVAVQMDKPFKIKTLHGRAIGKKGDWIGMTPKGDIYPIDKNIFIESYDEYNK